MGVSGLFDYYSGNILCAPLWIRRFALEGLLRMRQQPHRPAQRHLIGNWVFMTRVLGDRLRGKMRGKP
jgi:UDP-N-acetyl-D-mannosaminuronic acid transferase (WecB/TagA/CpsF family)